MADLSRSQQEFLTRYAPYANLASQQLGLPSRVILAKLALETGWGEHYANNNLPGLKTGNADQNDGFGSAQTKTWEDYGGSGRTNIKDGFIKYPTPEQSIGGLVPWLSNSTYMNSLADRQGGGIFDRDSAAEAAAVSALGSSGFSTDRNASAGVNTILAKLPNLSSYGVAPSFDPSIVNLMNYVPYNGATGQANVSEGLGGFVDNNYNSGTEFQKQGELLSREKGTGIQLPSPTPGNSGKTPGLLDQFSDGLTAGLENAGNAAKDAAGQFGGAISDLFNPAPGPAPGPYDFANGGTPGGIGDANFGAGIAPAPLPGPAPGPYDFGSGVAGGDTPNGSFGAGIGQPSLTPTQTIGAGPNAPTVPYNGFDAKAYLAANSDVAAAGLDPLQHYLQYGFKEGRTLDPEGHQIAPGFDAASYLRANPDVAAARIDPLTHYLVNGAAEGRTIGAPSLSPTLGPNGVASTLGPANSVTAFDPGAYLQANQDVAAANLNPLEHYLRYGQYEDRNLNLSGQKFDKAAYLASSPDVAAAGMSPLQHYLEFGSKEGRQAQLVGPDGQASLINNWLPAGTQMPTNLAEILNTAQAARTQGPGALTQTIGANTAQTVGATDAPTIGPQGSEFAGTFNPTEYLTANQDVAQAGMDPLQHYLKYGFAEGRAINPGGAHINQAFDPSAYLQANPDVAAAKLDPLAHYLLNGASEGRAAPTGRNPYSFSNFNVSQGLGPVGPGAFGLSGVTGGAGSPMPSFGGQNVSQGVPNGSFGSGITPTPQISPYGFSGLNPSGFLGATAQSLGGSYAVGSAADLGFGGTGGGGGSGGDGTIDPFGFGGDVSGFDVNNLGGSATQESPGASGYGDGVAIQGRNNQASQNAFIAGEWKKAADSTAAARLLGEQITNVAPGNQTNYALGAINPMQTPSIQQTPFTPVNMSGVFAPMPTAMFMPRFTF